MGKPGGKNGTPNALLRAALKAGAVTYEALAWQVRGVAAEMGISLRTSRASVAQWVAGASPAEETVFFVVEALSRHLGRTVSAEEIGLTTPALGPTLDWRTDTLAALNDLGRLDLDKGRRRALSAAAYSVAALAVPGSTWWTQQAERAASRSATGRRRIGLGDLDAARDMVAAFSRIDQRHGGGHARAAVVQYLTSDVWTYLNSRFTDDRVRKGMFSAASELAYLSGWMAFDNAEQTVAQHYFTKAVGLAAEADDAPMAGHVLRAMAHQAVDLGHPDHALELAAASVDGQRYELATPRERALLGAVHARALAATGQRRAAAAALLRAEDDLAGARPGDEEPGRIFFFSEASLAHETACALRDTGDLEGARREFRRSVRTRKASTFTRTHAVTLGYLGSVQASQGAIEEACATWARALDAMDGIHSARARRTAADMRQALSPVRRRGIPAVVELDGRAAAYLAASA
ncbi:Tat pathway signal protein [Streptomyces johnsoniae]|uniref:Tat pathway signal protein n=1 Tax=Streptomyces johnsoniae TaxID=3075532 RepID=A0ABU2S7U0_9ACTN|nr:Tat pathway signal protein [Streptomyces sp. DSM 41886]MDT0445046.1 Tat pathway signal protein [Streptomyces sp. DSM 41886]